MGKKKRKYTRRPKGGWQEVIDSTLRSLVARETGNDKVLTMSDRKFTEFIKTDLMLFRMQKSAEKFMRFMAATRKRVNHATP